MPYYLDTSAALKLVVPEPETPALRRWLRKGQVALVASDLLRTELLRATRRSAPARLDEARLVLDTVTLLAMPTEVFRRAGAVNPASLRSLDALHLAVAEEIVDELEGFVTYDERLGAAAAELGMAVIAPA